MQRFAVNSSPRKRAWTLAGRVFLAAVILGNIIGLLGSIVAAVYYSQSSDYSSAGAAAWAANDTAAGKSYEQQARKRAGDADAAASVQRFSEVCVLIVIIAAFLVVGFNRFGVWGLGFGVWGLGSGVRGWGLEFSPLGFRV